MLGFLAPYMQEVIEAAEAALDGRAARALRTRNAVVDAVLDLIEEGHLRPSAAMVADRARVSLRSVYQHFDDVETLFQIAGERHQQRLAHLEPLPKLPDELGPRIHAYVAHKARWLEAVSPMARAAALQAPFSPGVRARLAAAWERHSQTLRAAFATELAQAEDPERLLHAVEVATSWPAWESLRTTGLSEAEAASVLELSLRRLLD